MKKVEHTKGELRLIRSSKYSGDIFVKIKGTERKFLCKFYGGRGTEISSVEAEANVCHFVQCWKDTPPDPQHGRRPKPKPECDNCVYLEADGEIINEQIEKIMRLEARLEEPENVKPLAQYLDEYIEYEYDKDNIGEGVGILYAWDSWCELLQQALDAYESTEGVVIQIIKKKVR